MLLPHLGRRFTTSALIMLVSGVMTAAPMAQAADAHPAVAPQTSGAWRFARVGKLPDGTQSVAAEFSVDRLVQQVLRRNPGSRAMQATTDVASVRIEPAGALDGPMVSHAVVPNTPGGPSQGLLNQNAQISQKFPWPGTLALRNLRATSEAEFADQRVVDLRLGLASLARANYAQWYYVHRRDHHGSGFCRTGHRRHRGGAAGGVIGTYQRQCAVCQSHELFRLLENAP